MNRRRSAAALFLLALALTVAACRSEPVARPEPKRVVDLSPPLTPSLAHDTLGSRVLSFLGTDGVIQHTPIVPTDPRFEFGMETVCVFSHGGSHLDAPARLLRGGEHAAQVGVERLIGTARVVDLRWHDRQSPLEISDLELTPIQAGEIVILFVGYQSPDPNQWPRYPALSRPASEWLVAKGVAAVATDMPTIGSYEEIYQRQSKGRPAADVWSEYIPLFQAGIPVISGLVNLERIVEETDVVFVGLPLSLSNGTGAPVRAAALVY